MGRSTAAVRMPSFVAGQGELVDYSLQNCRPPGTTAAVDCCRCRGSPAVAHGSGVGAGGGEKRHAAAVGERGGVEL